MTDLAKEADTGQARQMMDRQKSLLNSAVCFTLAAILGIKQHCKNTETEANNKSRVEYRAQPENIRPETSNNNNTTHFTTKIIKHTLLDIRNASRQAGRQAMKKQKRNGRQGSYGK